MQVRGAMTELQNYVTANKLQVNRLSYTKSSFVCLMFSLLPEDLFQN